MFQNDSPDGSVLQSPTVFDDDQVEWEDGACRCRIKETDEPSEAVIVAVNRCIERSDRAASMLEQTPLYERIDPDALNSLFAPHTHSTGEVSFEYAGYDVTVKSHGEVVVHSSDSVANG